MILKLFDVAHSTRVSPLSFRWPRPKHPVALSDVFVCPPTFALKSPSQLCNVFAFPGSYQWCCRSCQSLNLSEMSLAHILERSSVGICLLCVGQISREFTSYVLGIDSDSDSDAFKWSYCRPRRPLLRPNLVAVAEATWKKIKYTVYMYVKIIVIIKSIS